MKSNFILHRYVTWIATIAILFNVFAPSVSYAITGITGTGGQFVAVCTSTGIQYIKLDLNADSDTPVNHQVQTECSYCLSLGHLPALPSAAHAPKFVDATSIKVAAPKRDLIQSRFAWTSSLARAPPPALI